MWVEPLSGTYRTHPPAWGGGFQEGVRLGSPKSVKNPSCPELRKKHPPPCHLPSCVFPPRNKVSRTGHRRTCPFHSHHNNMQNKCPFTQGTRVWCLSSGRGPAPGKMNPSHSRTRGPAWTAGGPASMSTGEAALASACTSCTRPPCPRSLHSLGERLLQGARPL